MTANLKVLIGKLDPACRKATERAINYCVARRHYEVEPEHLLLALLDDSDSDLSRLARLFDVSRSAFERDLLAAIAGFKTGNTRTPVFGLHLSALFEQAWLLASLDGAATQVRSGHLLLALLTAPDLAQLASRSSAQFARFPLEELKHKLAKITADFPEAGAVAADRRANGLHPHPADTAHTATPALDQFTSNLTQRARDGSIDPVIGRDAEIRQLIDILMRRRQNNPILTGEAGVGKTAVVEGLAQRIAQQEVPPPLANVALHVLDLGLLQAGASARGEFENRLRNVIDEVKRSPNPVILFIDEAHTMIGAGGQPGQNDAANLLKPALARGELRTIAATTWSEYKKYFEKDSALARRFQVVKVEEPSEALACTMLRGMVPKMEAHFNVRVSEQAIIDAVRLAARYISARQLPDKAVALLDTACSRVALARTSTPAAVEDGRRRDQALADEIAALARETATGAEHDERLAALRAHKQSNLAELARDEQRWQQEKVLVDRICALRAELELSAPAGGGNTGAGAGASPRLGELLALQQELATLQGERPLIPVCVDGQTVGEIVAAWTGIPLGRMVKDEIRTVLNLKQLMQQRVIGQAHALDQIAQRICTARAGIEDPGKPKGVFLFVGPSGVGKTETALALAEALYGGERNLITINMSEYQEAHTVSGLKGAPPGYVGYGEGGVLTEAVRRRPYSVVLLDEVEKAHTDVLEMFFQVFDKGVMEDAEGRDIDFRNTVIILTSNVGSATIMQQCLNKSADELPAPDALAGAILPQLHKCFKPAFLGRMKVIPYYPLPDEVLADIIRLKLGCIGDRIQENHQAEFAYDDELVELVLARCSEVDSGARNVDHILNGTLLPQVAATVLARMAEGTALRSVRVAADSEGNFCYDID